MTPSDAALPATLEQTRDAMHTIRRAICVAAEYAAQTKACACRGCRSDEQAVTGEINAALSKIDGVILGAEQAHYALEQARLEIVRLTGDLHLFMESYLRVKGESGDLKDELVDLRARLAKIVRVDDGPCSQHPNAPEEAVCQSCLNVKGEQYLKCLDERDAAEDERDAARIALAQAGPRCDFCGALDWTLAKYERTYPIHKHACPHRQECQGHLDGCIPDAQAQAERERDQWKRNADKAALESLIAGNAKTQATQRAEALEVALVGIKEVIGLPLENPTSGSEYVRRQVFDITDAALDATRQKIACKQHGPWTLERDEKGRVTNTCPKCSALDAVRRVG